jgi:hypothetical protein
MSGRNQRVGKRSTSRALFELLEDRRLFSSIVVNSVLDQIDPAGSSVVTLRDAITRANAATTSTAITFNPTVFSTLKTITLSGSRLIIQNASSANSISITGPAAGVTINGNNASGDFVVWTNTTASLTGLRIVGGKSTNGAGVDNYGNATVTNCTITQNSSPNGGGVFNSGNAFILNDTISNNTGTTGGGIWNTDGGYVSVTDSTISGNTASYGGGIYNGGTSNGTVQLHNATISNNTAGAGGGLFNYAAGTVGLTNSIIAGNKRTSGLSLTDVDGVFASRGYNLIGNIDGSTGWITSDLTGTSTALLNADLNPLGSYGGPTYTMTLAAGSPALGAGLPSLISWEKNDQRGLPRVVNGKVDIGAIETQTPLTTLPIPTVLAPGSTVAPGPVLTTLTPAFTWKPITTGITGYQLNLYDITSSKSFTYTTGASVDSFTLPAGVLTAGDKYVWNLRVLNGNVSGPPSVYLYFVAPPATALPVPVVIGPGSNPSPGTLLTTLTPTFTWHAVTSGISGYQLNLYDITLAKFVSYQIGASQTSFTVPTALGAGHTFVWNLRVIEAGVTGTESAYLYFQTPTA